MKASNQVPGRLELYLHIPFCVRKCEYCDFLSAPAANQTIERYLDALLEELEGRSAECSGYVVDTVFIGGGTPSLVQVERIAEVIGLIRRYYCLAEDAEISMEVNPGTVDAGKLEGYRRCGINRLSIGLQSAVDAELQRLGRIHSFDTFRNTYRQVREAGFTNVNVDLMSALPGQSVDSWKYSLEAVLHLNPPPEHISAYSLIVEEGTPFYEAARKGMLDLPEEEVERQMYEMSGTILEQAGYHRYEISNYAKEGYACRHNCGYWKRTEYLGFGIGAASLMKETRFINTVDLEAYLADPLGARTDVQELDTEAQMEEFMFLGLRLTEGVSALAFEDRFGRSIESVYGAVLERNQTEELLEKVSMDPVSESGTENGKENEGRGGRPGVSYRLTARGLDLSNYVMAQFLF